MSSVKIAIVSPSRRQGETTFSVMLALALAEATGKRVCLTATGADYLSMRTFLSIPEIDDITRSVSQLNQLIESGQLEDGAMKDYLTSLTPFVDVLISSSVGMTEHEGDRLFSNAIKLIDHDFIITDLNSAVDSDVAYDIYENYDMIVVAISQDVVVKKKLQTWKKSKAFPDANKVTYVVNGYDPTVSDVRQVAKEIGVRYSTKLSKLNLNPWIRKQGNDGKLVTLMTYINNKDSRVIDLYYDMGDILKMIGMNLCFPVKWGDD